MTTDSSTGAVGLGEGDDGHVAGAIAYLNMREDERAEAMADACLRMLNHNFALRAEVERLTERNAELEGFREHCDLLTHKVITCGVAADHPDANLSRTGAYSSKWNSPQAERVRVLRDRAERAEADLAESRHDYEIQTQYVEALKVRVAGLSRDAERYRWLKEEAPDEWDVMRWISDDLQEIIMLSDLDTAIDAAMAGCKA